MGTTLYGAGTDAIHIDDRALAHPKVVVATKLRRNESFTLSWRHPRTSLAYAPQSGYPSIPFRFTFEEPEAPELNVKWVEELMHSANSAGGTQLIDEVLDSPTG
ncbi:hypothetical protein [Microbacterium sp. W4I20]|uniref:DUF7882 family protein n=1 Tax=Microbacterium sp. W4I20 TaxID=3042262 RepID=UPI0027850431|nr:hypothetical protein [Microbacterium sp. W4I20]MDQ0729147.1 hypothetical protein [Microbacterium sp. W4I20]